MHRFQSDLVVQPDAGPLYVRVGHTVETQIRQGVLKPGEKLPSIRFLSEQQQVSISTALQAYLWLENAGWIEARPRSGFYVRKPKITPLPEPDSASQAGEPAEAGIAKLMREIMGSARQSASIPFGTATPGSELLPSRKLASILGRITRVMPAEIARYEFPPGYEPLRRQIARRSPEFGCNFSHNSVVITHGAMEALHLSLRAVASPGDMIAVESPLFYGALQSIDLLGYRIIEIPTHPRNGMDLDALEDAIRKHRVKACMVMSNVHNPLGFVLDESWKRELASLAAIHEIAVIEDEVYGDLCFTPGARTTVKQFDKEGLVLLCGSFSKTLGPGYRIGFVEPGRFRPAVEQLQLASTIGAATLQQLGLADFLASGGYERHLRRLRSAFERNMQSFGEAVAQHFPPGTRMTRPGGGFLLWIQLPSRMRGMRLYERARAKGISIVPGDAFSASKSFPGYIRISCGHPWSSQLEAAVAELGRICASLPAE